MLLRSSAHYAPPRGMGPSVNARAALDFQAVSDAEKQPARLHRGGFLPDVGSEGELAAGTSRGYGFVWVHPGDAVLHVAKRWQHCSASGPLCEGRPERAWEGGLASVLQGSGWGPQLWLGLREGMTHLASSLQREDSSILEALGPGLR